MLRIKPQTLSVNLEDAIFGDSLKYFEDFVVGEAETVGEYHLTQEDVIEFGKQWDPQFFHINPESVFAELCGHNTGGKTAISLVKTSCEAKPKK